MDVAGLRDAGPWVPGPNVRLLGEKRPLFQVIGLVGWALAIALAMATAGAVGRSSRTVALLALVAFATFLVLAVARKLITGSEGLTYYHHVVGVLALAAVTLRIAGQPVMPYLDHVALGLALFDVVGRVGCLMAGCCHGRPWRRGVRYGSAHVAAGFPSGLEGVPLVPAPLLEAAWVAGITVAGTWLVLAGARAGTALALYLTGYAAGRFGLEFLRGDPGRAYAAGFSEAQWTSLAVLWTVVGAGSAGVLPSASWEVVVAATATSAAIAVAVERAMDGSLRHWLTSAKHVSEVAGAIVRLERHPAVGSIPAVAETSFGLRLSLSDGTGGRHYALSLASRPLRSGEARAMARLLSRLRPSGGGLLVQAGRHGVFHVSVRTAA